MTETPEAPAAANPAIFLPHLIAGPAGAALAILLFVKSMGTPNPAWIVFSSYVLFGLPACVFAFTHKATFEASGKHSVIVLWLGLALGLLCVPLLQLIGFVNYPTFAEAIYTDDFSQIFRLGLPATALAGYLAVLALAPKLEKPPLPPASE